MATPLTLSKAEDEEEKRRLREIIAQEYFAEGYIPADDERLLRSAHYDGVCGTRFAIRNTDTGGIIGTMALAIDSPSLLLPMDSLYNTELSTLRTEGLLLAEVGQFAVTRSVSMYERLLIVKKLFETTTRELEERNIHAVVITVNPKHDSAYSLFGFDTFADTRMYSAVGGAPAVPKLKFLRKPAPREEVSQGIHIATENIL